LHQHPKANFFAVEAAMAAGQLGKAVVDGVGGHGATTGAAEATNQASGEPAGFHHPAPGFAAGLGTVTKGVGFLPLLVLLPFAAWRWRVRGARRPAGTARDLWWLLPAFLLGTAVWLAPLGVALLHSADPALHAYARELLFKQTGTRYANAWHHVKPAWYYLQVMATLWLPGSLLLPALVPA
jgi:hypothetical protein